MDQGIKCICDLCGELIDIGRPRFVLEGKLYCAYDGGTFDESTLGEKGNLQDEIQKLMKIAEAKSEKELNDEVYYSYRLDLCRKCRDKVYGLLEGTHHPPQS